MSRHLRHAMTINPVVLMSLVYLVANFVYFLIAFNGLEIQVDQLVSSFSPEISIVAFSLISLSVAYVYILYFINTRFVFSPALYMSDAWGYSLLFLQVSYAASSAYYGVNIAGVENSTTNPIGLIFKILDPDILFLVVGVSIRSPRLFWANALVYLLSSVLRGWSGAFVLLPILLFCRYHPLRLKLHVVFYLCLGGGVLLCLSPFLIEIKWLIRSGGDAHLFVDNVLSKGYLESLEITVNYIFIRFQHLGHVALLTENSRLVFEGYQAGDFIPYWADGIPQWIYLTLEGVDIIQLNRFMVDVFFSSDNSAYSTHPGMAGWLSVLGVESAFFLFFVFVLVFFPAYYVGKYGGLPRFLLMYSFVFVFLFHGWIGAYVNFVLYMVGAVVLQKIKLFGAQRRIGLPA